MQGGEGVLKEYRREGDAGGGGGTGGAHEGGCRRGGGGLLHLTVVESVVDGIYALGDMTGGTTIKA